MIKIPDDLAIKHLQSRLCKGDVLFWQDFPGVEQLRDSHFIILTECISGEYIYVRATARVHLYYGPDAKRAQTDTLLLPKGTCTIFAKETMLDFKMISRFEVGELAKLLGTKLKIEGKLEDSIIKQIESVIKSSKTIRQKDIDLILNSR